MRPVILVTLAIPLCLAAAAQAQQSPFLPDPFYRVISNEISGEISYEHVRWFTHWHRPTAGSEGFEAIAKYTEQKAKEYGLEDVRRINVKSDGEKLFESAAKAGLVKLVAPRAPSTAPDNKGTRRK